MNENERAEFEKWFTGWIQRDGHRQIGVKDTCREAFLAALKLGTNAPDMGTAARHTQSKQVRELVEAVGGWDKCDSTLTAAKINAGPPAISLAKQLLDEAERGLRTALAQLKETPQ